MEDRRATPVWRRAQQDHSRGPTRIVSPVAQPGITMSSGLGRSNTYAGRSKLRQASDAAAQDDDEHATAASSSQDTATGVRRHASLHVGRGSRDTSSSTAAGSGTTRTGKPRSASSSLTIDTAARKGSPAGEGSSEQTSPLTRSPISGNALGRTPWSPTAEEAAKLINQKASLENAREAFERMDMATTGDDRTTSLGTSSVNATANKRLPPLTTSFNGGLSAAPSSAGANGGLVESPTVMPYRGPSSAAAFVRPIGGFNSSQSRVFEERPNRNIPMHSNGAATAVVGSGASSWLQQKALIAGDPQPGSAQKGGRRRTTEIEEPSTIDEETRSYATDSPPDFNQPLPYTQPQSLAAPFASVTSHQTSMPNFAYDQPAWMNGLHTNAMAALAQSVGGGGLGNTPFSWSMGPQPQPQQQQHRPNLSSLNTAPFLQGSQPPSHLDHLYASQQQPQQPQQQQQNTLGMPSTMDVHSMAMAKGWNPPRFDCRPPQAKFCVIKSYTEDDIHKSIKYEIWSSTKLGNQRLDRVFKEGSPYGPVYLLFSVNGSGHFAGIAEMLTPVDESVSSNVWTDSKWKGIFKLRWIYIKDVPNHALRHLRLTNTQENKPVTSSRDTQEVPYDVGCEMLRIITSYNSKTSLLQDFAFYELKSSQFGTGEQLPLQQPRGLAATAA